LDVEVEWVAALHIRFTLFTSHDVVTRSYDTSSLGVMCLSVNTVTTHCRVLFYHVVA